MKKSHIFARRRNGPDIASLSPITEKASIGQIFCFRFAAVFSTDDVIDLASKKGIIFMDQAIFAKVTRRLATT